MKILVVSDIHAFTVPREGGLLPSYVRTNDTSDRAPIVMLERLLREREIPTPDIIVSPGDLGDQSDATGVGFAWEFLKRLARLTSKKTLIATAGNHDIDSRYKGTDFDAKGALLNLKPGYPILSNLDQEDPQDIRHHLMFWAWNFYLVSLPKCRFVVLNSSAFHGAGQNNKEFEHGRISAYTLDKIRKALLDDDRNRAEQQLEPPLISVLLCHHHLQKDGTITDADYSAMSGGHALIDFMSSADNGPWFAIHGHRHRARLFQTGGIAGPFVLSAGSFGATRDKDYDNASPNQVHLVELDFQSMDRFRLYPAGTIMSWTWTPGIGWVHEKSPGGGLPPTTGFGFRGSVDQVAQQIDDELVDVSCQWKTLLKKQPILAHFDWMQLTELKTVLSRRHKIILTRSEDGIPWECARAT